MKKKKEPPNKCTCSSCGSNPTENILKCVYNWIWTQLRRWWLMMIMMLWGIYFFSWYFFNSVYTPTNLDFIQHELNWDRRAGFSKPAPLNNFAVHERLGSGKIWTKERGSDCMEWMLCVRWGEWERGGGRGDGMEYHSWRWLGRVYTYFWRFIPF